MKTKLLLITLILSITVSYSQTTYNIYPDDDVNQIFLDALNGQGGPGDITFNFYSDTFDVSTINIHDIGDQKNTPSRIIIKSNANNADSVIIKSSESSVFFIETSYVTVQNLTIMSIPDASAQSVIKFQENQMYLGLDSIIIENCILIADSSSDNVISYQPIEDANISNIYIRNNQITKGDFGIKLNFYEYGDEIAKNITIENNTFRVQNINSIDLSRAMNIKLINNNIELPTLGDNIYNKSAGIILQNIYAYSDVADSLTIISNNRIYTNTPSQCLYTGISLSSCNANGQGRFLIFNNFIDIESNDLLTIGLENSGSGGIEFYNNTIKLLSPNSKGILYKFGGMKTNFIFGFRNNIIFTGNIILESTHDMYNNDINFNNNCYFSTNSVDVFNVNGIYYDYLQWQSTFNIDQNSFFDDPQFIGFNNPTPHNPTLSNLAPTLPDVNYDINGVVRNLPNSDFGAKEVAFVNLGNDTILCFGESILLDAGPAQSYIWNTGATSQVITTDTTGQYIVTITEFTGGATATDTINVDISPEISISFNSAEPTCYTSTNGYIDASVINATTPINYNWAGSFDGDGTDSLYNLGIGSYYLTVTDANLCTAENYSFINAPTQLSLSFDTIEFCGGCIGELTANATGGTGSYSYTWNNGSTNSHIMDLCTGTYIITLIDDNGCVFIDSVSITEGALGYLAGTIDYSGGNFNSSEIKVELYKQYIENAFQVEKVDEDMIDGASKFEFTGVYPYQYTFRSIVEQGSYQNVVTSYYGNTVDWYNATYVTIGCGDTINDIEFVMYEVNNLNGTGTFSGTVTYEASDKSTNQAGEPVTGAEIYIAQDPNIEPVANTYSNSNGYWEVDGIQEGTGYRLRVDIPGLEQISTYENLYITPDDTVQTNLNFIVDTTSGGGIMADTAFSSIKTNNQTIDIEVYPNPSTDFVSFETSLKSAANIKFEIVNIKGKILYTSEELNAYVGNFKVKVDISDYTVGTYLLKFKIDNNYYLKKIIKQ